MGEELLGWLRFISIEIVMPQYSMSICYRAVKRRTMDTDNPCTLTERLELLAGLQTDDRLFLSQITVYVNQHLGLITFVLAEITGGDIDLFPCRLIAKLAEHI